MAVFIKMRSKMGIFIVVLISLAIVGFLAQDAMKGDKYGFGNRQGSVLAKVNGTKIKATDFDAKVQNQTADYLLFNPNTPQDAQFSGFIHNQAWQLMLYEILMGDQFDKAGIYVSNEELVSVITDQQNPHPLVKQIFTNQKTGIFDPSSIMLFVNNLDNPQTTDEQRRIWEYLKREVRKDIFQSKYEGLIDHAMYVPSFMAQDEYENANTQVAVNYVMVPYSSVDDAGIKIEDKDLKNYIKEHENESRFKQEQSVKMSYVLWPIKPSKQDTAETREKFMKQMADFAAGKTVKQDSIFAGVNNPEPYNRLSDKYLTSTDLGTSVIKDTVFKVDTMKAYGPFLENNQLMAIKVLDRKKIPDSVQSRHLLIPVRTQEEVKSRKVLADSLQKVIAGGTPIDSIWKKLPSDMQSVTPKRDWGWTKPTDKTKPMAAVDFMFYSGKQGDVKVVPGEQGFEIVQITKATPVKDAVRLSYFVMPIDASSETEKAIFAVANEFASKNRKKEDFEKAGQLMNIRTADEVLPTDFTVVGIGPCRDLVRWAFGAKAGEVSSVTSAGDQYVVALVEKKREKGLRDLDDVHDEVLNEVMKDKKAEIISKKLEDAAKSSTDLNAIATATGGTVAAAQGISFANVTFPSGDEPKVAAAAAALAQNAMSKPVEGTAGVYLLQATAIQNAPAMTDYTPYSYQVISRLRTSVTQNIFKILVDKATIKDNRISFY